MIKTPTISRTPSKSFTVTPEIQPTTESKTRTKSSLKKLFIRKFNRLFNRQLIYGWIRLIRPSCLAINAFALITSATLQAYILNHYISNNKIEIEKGIVFFSSLTVMLKSFTIPIGISYGFALLNIELITKKLNQSIFPILLSIAIGIISTFNMVIFLIY